MLFVSYTFNLTYIQASTSTIQICYKKQNCEKIISVKWLQKKNVLYSFGNVDANL